MKLSSWKLKLLSGMLCFCLIFQSLTISASADEGADEGQTIEMQEQVPGGEEIPEEIVLQGEQDVELTEEAESTEEAEVSETVEETEEAEVSETVEETEEAEVSETVEETAEAEVSETVESTEEAEVSEESEMTENITIVDDYVLAEGETQYGTLSNVQVIPISFGVYLKSGGTYSYDTSTLTGYHYLDLACYDANDNLQSVRSVTTVYGGRVSTASIYQQYYPVHADTAYIRLELRKQDGTLVEAYDRFEVEAHPDITVSVDEVSPGVNSVKFDVSYEGDLKQTSGTTSYSSNMYLELSYGTTKDESSWKTSRSSFSFNTYSGNQSSVIINGLEDNTTYYGKVRIYAEVTDRRTWESVSVWEQVIDVEPFATAQNNTYNLKESFPDPVFRAAILDQLDNYDSTLTEDSNVTSSQFEKITYLNLNRTDASAAAIKDITGIELLTALSTLYLKGHEISSVDQIDWNKVSRLSSLYLDSNDITVLPDLSEHPSLSNYSFNYNMISEEELANAADKLPKGKQLASSLFQTQRTNGLELQYDVDNYVYGSAVPLTVYINGFKKDLTYTIKTYIDDQEVSMNWEQNYTPMRLSSSDTKLSEGAHTIQVKLYNGENLAEESEKYTFNIVNEPIFLEEVYSWIEDGRDLYSLYVSANFNYNPSVAKMSLVDQDGKIYAEGTQVSSSSTTSDSRYEVVTNVSYRNLYRVSSTMNVRYNTIPAGNYDLVFTYNDNTQTRLEDVIRVFDGETPVITDANLDSQNDNTGEYMYISLSGVKIDPSKLSYNVVQFGKNYPLTYVSYKETSSGLTVKLKKEGWTNTEVSAVSKLQITPKEGYAIVNADPAIDLYISGNVFYCDYNVVTGKLEAAFPAELNVDGKNIKVSVREGYSATSYPVIATGEAIASGDAAYFELTSADGTAFVPARKTYYFNFEVSGKTYTVNDYVNADTNTSGSTNNRWSAYSIVEGTELAYAYYYSDIPYESEVDPSELSVKIIDESQEITSVDADIWTYNDSGNTTIGISFPAGSLKIGQYAISLYKGDYLFAQTAGTMNVVSSEKFIVNSVSAYWENESSIRLYVNTPFTRESDDYDVIITDYEGNEVQGLTASVAERYSTNVLYISISGLEYKDAQGSYYVKIRHKTLGDAVDAYGNPFYSDASGMEYRMYHSNTVSISMEKDRIVKIYENSAQLPLTLKIYKPYGLSLVKEVQIAEEDFVDGTYYMPKELYDSLPDKDALYDVVMLSSNGKGSFYDGYSIGYSGMFEDLKKWTYTVDKTTLYAGVEGEDKAVIKVENNMQLPSFASSNPMIASVTVSEEDSSMAIVQAHATGETVITITVGDMVKEFTVTVTQKPQSLKISHSSLTMAVNGYIEINAYVLPWGLEGYKINYKSSDESVVRIEEVYENNMALLQAVGKGNATITATLEGTDIQATCKINVWDFTINGKPYQGTVRLYANSTDQKTAVLKVSGTNVAPTFSTTDPEILVIDAVPGGTGEAYIHGVGTGHADVIITVGNDSLSFSVVVINVVEKIELSEKNITMGRGDFVGLSARVVPEDAQTDFQRILFSSSDPEVVAIHENSNGNITLEALKPGVATITAGYEGTSKTATCKVVVLWECEIDTELEEGVLPLYVNIEGEKTATIQVLGSETAKPTFKSSNTSVVTIAAVKGDTRSAVVTAVGIGEAEIAITADGMTKTIPVVVDKKVMVEGLVMNHDTLTMKENSTEILAVNVLPAEAQSMFDEIGFEVASSDSMTVLASKDENNNIVLNALCKGRSTITATITVGEEIYTATCDVEVVDVFNEGEQAQKTEAESKFVLLNTYPKNAASLKDISLSEGWTWVDENIKLTADDTAPIQYYPAVYEEEGYEPFTALIQVAVSKLTGIAVEGDKTLLSETTGEYNITYKYTGYQPEEVDDHGFDSHYSIDWAAAGSSPLVSIEETEGTAVRFTAADVTANKSQNVNVVLKVDHDKSKTFKTTLKLTVLAKPYVDDIVVEEAQEQAATVVVHTYDPESQIIYVDLEDISTAKGAVTNTISLSALAKALELDSAVKMKWTSSDTSVAALKATADGKEAVVTVKKAGSAVIKITAQDGGKYEEEVLVVVKDYKPVIESTSVTVNAFSTEGVPFVIREQNGNEVIGAQLLENGEVSDRMLIQMTDRGYEIRILEDSGITKKTTIKPVLRITTADGKTHDQVISVVVDVKKPTATLSVKTKANLFYTDSEAVYKITSKDSIASIEDITVADGYRFHLADVDLANGLLAFNTEAEWSPDIMSTYAANTGKPITEVKLKVNFEGYTDDAAQIVTVKVSTSTIKPTLKMNDITFIPGVTEGITQVYDTKAKAVYVLTDEDIEITYDNSKTGDVAAEKTADGVKVTYDGTATVSYKATLSSAKWTQDLVLNGKITVVKQQDLVLGSNKITLNTATSVQKNGLTAIDVSVKNHEAAVESIAFQTDKSSAPLINNGYLYLDFDKESQQILLGLNQNKQGNIKNGTYKLTINGTIQVAGQSIALKKTTLSITLTNKAPSVSLTAKGSIDLVQRDATSILYTAKLANITADVADVRLAGTYAEYFEAQMEDGKVKIVAADNPMSTKISYFVDIILLLDNGMEVTKNVKIKPVSKNPKITAGLTKGILYKAADNTMVFGLRSSIPAAEIEKVVQVTDKNSKHFDFGYEDGRVTISLSEQGTKLKPGSYTISYKVYFEGMAYNTSPVTVKFTATVK